MLLAEIVANESPFRASRRALRCGRGLALFAVGAKHPKGLATEERLPFCVEASLTFLGETHGHRRQTQVEEGAPNGEAGTRPVLFSARRIVKVRQNQAAPLALGLRPDLPSSRSRDVTVPNQIPFPLLSGMVETIQAGRPGK